MLDFCEAEELVTFDNAGLYLAVNEESVDDAERYGFDWSDLRQLFKVNTLETDVERFLRDKVGILILSRAEVEENRGSSRNSAGI